MYGDENKTDAPDTVSQMKEKLYAQAEHVRHQNSLKQESAGAMIGEAVRPSLRERVNSSLHRAERETRYVSRLKELADLLGTNPAIARILELIETTGV